MNSFDPARGDNCLTEKKRAGSFTLNKGSKSIDDLFITGSCLNKTRLEAIIKLGGGPTGAQNISIPGATYLSQDKGNKVSYDSLEVSPLFLSYESDIYELVNKNINLVGLKLAVKK